MLLLHEIIFCGANQSQQRLFTNKDILMTSYTAQDTQPHKRLQFTARMTATPSACNVYNINTSKHNKTARPEDKRVGTDITDKSPIQLVKSFLSVL